MRRTEAPGAGLIGYVCQIVFMVRQTSLTQTVRLISMSIPLLLILGFATWRISNLLVLEKGPFNVFVRIRELAGIIHDTQGEPYQYPDNFLAELLSCVWCTSVWVGTAWAIAWLLWPEVTVKVSVPFALSAIAIVIDKYLKS